MKESIIKYNKEKDGFFIKVQMIAGDSHEKKKFDCFLRIMDFWHVGYNYIFAIAGKYSPMETMFYEIVEENRHFEYRFQDFIFLDNMEFESEVSKEVQEIITEKIRDNKTWKGEKVGIK